MTKLEERLIEYSNAYYQGNELIDDAAYDALIEQLRKENPDSSLLPENQGIAGSDLKGISKKYKLPHCMNTLAKCADNTEFKKWWNSHSHDDIVVSLKLDGNSQLLEYKNGKFVRSLSRGNGEYGENTTNNISLINFPKDLKEDFTGYIRGEVFLKRSIWEVNFPGEKNPRNSCAGLTSRKDTDPKMKLLSFGAYEVFGNNITTEKQKYEFLERNGFETPAHEFNPTFERIVEWKDSLDTNGEIPCDGLVLKQNVVDWEDAERHCPLSSVAFKPKLQIAETVLKDISWEMKGRYLSPVAILEPVEIEGATVSRASLANINIMENLGIEIGSRVMVVRRGLIIPKIIGVAEEIV